MTQIQNKASLCKYVNGGHKVQYLCFWGHQKHPSAVTKSCLSQWYEAEFEISGITYQTAEHYMMAQKAQLFGDVEMQAKIIAAESPGKAKGLGRKIEGFNEEQWVAHRFNIVVAGNIAKFSQNPALKAFLLSTGNKILVEASPVDRIWGVGLAADDPMVENPNLWNGLNLLGFALMDVRSRLVAG